MISIDEAEQMLDEIALEIPKEFFGALNGGILLLPDVKLHPDRLADDLYILGEYHYNHALGRYIALYYGSFERLFGHCTPAVLRAELKKTLLHEFTHHLESLAGERGLEVKDERSMDAYRRQFRDSDRRRD